MIPLRALLYRNLFPATTLVIIFINVVCFLYELSLPRYAEPAFMASFAIVPDRFRETSLVTAIFLHGGWLHLIGNMWFLWIFGSHVEDRMGHIKFLIFYLICGIASGVLQVVASAGSPVPTIGASGAIAGVMGAFLLLFPRARIFTLIFLFIFFTTIEIPAAILLLYWFALQILGGLTSFGRITENAGGIAWFAHIGGFVAGMALLRIFAGTSRPRYSH
ncbi:MAG TPA: rhomboid family intramembrane serine protease [Bryobacteraceae bacterium]|jgi:membrane associated rhomboid family serine protease|nr:rhomboid family intramembrane serine protease [Bryobacteraceae bacterium]